MPLRTRIVFEPPRRPSATSRRTSSPTTAISARRHAEPPLHLAHGCARGLAHDDRPGAARLRDRGGDHRAAAQDRPVCARVGRDVAAGEQACARDDGAGGALELVEVDLVGVRDEHRVDVRAVATVDEVNAGLVEVRPRGLGRERQDARLPAEAVEVRLHGAERRQHLLVLDR